MIGPGAGAEQGVHQLPVREVVPGEHQRLQPRQAALAGRGQPRQQLGQALVPQAAPGEAQPLQGARAAGAQRGPEGREQRHEVDPQGRAGQVEHLERAAPRREERAEGRDLGSMETVLAETVSANVAVHSR